LAYPYRKLCGEEQTLRKHRRQYVIELDGMAWRCQGGRIERLDPTWDTIGDRWIVFDSQTAITRTMIVEAPAKYAEVIVRKRLQESGEVDGPVFLFTFHKEKKGPNATNIFFTALPIQVYNQYLEKTRSRDESVLLFPVFSVLHGFIKRIARRKPVAVVFQHGQFADLIVGSQKRTYYANRSMAFDTTDDQISALWDMVLKDIDTAEKEGRIEVDRIFLLNWINSASKEQWPGKTSRKVVTVPPETVPVDGAPIAVSFLKALHLQTPLSSFSPLLEQLSYVSRRSLPWLNVSLLGAVILFVVGFFWCNHQITGYEQALTANRDRMNALYHGESLPRMPYEETLSFVKEIDYYRKAPSYKQVVNDISEALPAKVTVEVLKVDYDDNQVGVEIYGKAKTTFENAHRAYERFAEELKDKGYVMAESKFDTKIHQSEFITRFTKRIL